MNFSAHASGSASDTLNTVQQAISRILDVISYGFKWVFENNESAATLYTGIIRWIMPILAMSILLSVLRRMLSVKNPKEVWGYLKSAELGNFPINHWESTIGRASHCDITIKFATVSKTQCAIIRADDGSWTLHNLSDINPTKVNGQDVTSDVELHHGDIINLGGVELKFSSISKQEQVIQIKRRMLLEKPVQPWTSFLLLSAFQVLTAFQLMLTRHDYGRTILACYGVLMLSMWGYVLITRAAGQRGFEPEILAFFACTMNLAVTATSFPSILPKQTAAIFIGLILFIILGYYMRDLERVVKTRYFMAGATITLFVINIVFGKLHFGARNWISIFGVSVQPSELAKICFIFAGAATLDRLFAKRNLFGFMCLSGFCLLALAVTGDFGTASIFFVVFLVIAYLRSGDFATLSLITGAAAGAILMIIRFKPYIAARFAVWGHAWEFASGAGYQQVRTMSASASGGLIGVGAGNGWLHNVAASNTDLVFGIICEEWGLIIALLTVAIIITLSIFTRRVGKNGRSSYYTIAACAATSLLVFQTILNVCGSTDILPLTGVTFPFVSCGGTSMLASWGLLAFVKAADTRQNASFAVKKKASLGEAPDDPLQELQLKNKLEARDSEDSYKDYADTNLSKFDSDEFADARNDKIYGNLSERSIAQDTIIMSRKSEYGKVPTISAISSMQALNPEIDKSKDDEIDEFFAKFEDDSNTAEASNSELSENDEIENFLKQFESIGTTNLDEDDWRS